VTPYSLLFGLGISLVVAPLTTTLMGSVSGRHSGVASAINNSISRVGQPLLGAIIFVAISATFYSSLGSKSPGLDTANAAIRHQFQPLNPPAAGTSQDQLVAATQASIDAFHLAALVAGALLLIGALVSWFGLRDQDTTEPG
jgi:Flp pilus assembly pilin Flp